MRKAASAHPREAGDGACLVYSWVVMRATASFIVYGYMASGDCFGSLEVHTSISRKDCENTFDHSLKHLGVRSFFEHFETGLQKRLHSKT